MESTVTSESWVSGHNIPLEICSKILSYLPAKSLLRFRCVSKAWKSMIEEPDFATLHLRCCASNAIESSLIVREGIMCRKAKWRVRCSKTFEETSSIECPQNSEWDVVGARDGLLLLSRKISSKRGDEPSKLVLWNPSIQKSVCVPPLLPLLSNLDDSSLHGGYCINDGLLGYDPSSNDYKIVTLVCYAFKSRSFFVFSLKNRSWSEATVSVEESPHQYKPINVYQNNISVGERIHWLGIACASDVIFDYTQFLVSLNLTTMTISYTPLPVHRPDDLWPPYFVGRSSFRLLTCDGIWAMKGQSSGQSHATWSKLYEMNKYVTAEGQYLHLKEEDGVLLIVMDEAVYAYDLISGEFNKLEFDIMAEVDDVNVHIESLLLLN